MAVKEKYTQSLFDYADDVKISFAEKYKEHERQIKAFVNHFYGEGFPKEEIIEILTIKYEVRLEWAKNFVSEILI